MTVIIAVRVLGLTPGQRSGLGKHNEKEREREREREREEKRREKEEREESAAKMEKEKRSNIREIVYILLIFVYL